MYQENYYSKIPNFFFLKEKATPELRGVYHVAPDQKRCLQTHLLCSPNAQVPHLRAQPLSGTLLQQGKKTQRRDVTTDDFSNYGGRSSHQAAAMP